MRLGRQGVAGNGGEAMECGGETEAGGFYRREGKRGSGPFNPGRAGPFGQASHSLIFTNLLIVAKMPVSASFGHIVYCMVTYNCIMIFIYLTNTSCFSICLQITREIYIYPLMHHVFHQFIL